MLTMDGVTRKLLNALQRPTRSRGIHKARRRSVRNAGCDVGVRRNG